jgi:acyl-CoA reductase-like NAD-dependent aldehyde dehydrogenase
MARRRQLVRLSVGNPLRCYKGSGIGREHGLEAMREYTQVKSVTVGLGCFQSRFDLIVA